MEMTAEVGREHNTTTTTFMPSDFVTTAKEIGQATLGKDNGEQ